jgi:hypothetical protein
MNDQETILTPNSNTASDITQLKSQCAAVLGAGDAGTLDEVLAIADTVAAGACDMACGAMLMNAAAAAPLQEACNVAGGADFLLNISAELYQNKDPLGTLIQAIPAL